MWQEVAQTKKSREMVAISSKDVKDCEWCRWGVRPLHFIEIHPCLWCRWGVRPLHFIETHPASKGPVVACRGKMWQEVAQTKKSRGMVAKMWKDSRGSRTLQKSESWDGFWVLILIPAAPIPLSHRATVLWCRWGVRPLHFIETHPASKGPVVACRGKMWQEVAQTKKSRGMVAKMWKDSRGSRTLQKSESWDGFWVLILIPAAPIPLSHRATVLWCRWGVSPSIL